MSEAGAATASRRWILNKKCLAVLKVLADTQGQEDVSKFNYVHVSSKGVTACNTYSFARVTLPQGVLKTQPEVSGIFPYAEAVKAAETQKELITMPEAEPAKTTAKFNVPNYESVIPDPKKQTATITVNAQYLVSLLQAAMEVTEHSRHLVRLRFYGNSIRIDAHADTGGQEFLGICMGTEYTGSHIPGDIPEGTPTQKPTTLNESNEQNTLKMPMHEGRKFRE